MLWTSVIFSVVKCSLTLIFPMLSFSEDWWSSLSASSMAKYVKVWKQALSEILSFQPVPLNSEVTSRVKSLLQVLQHMYNVSIYTRSNLLSFSTRTFFEIFLNINVFKANNRNAGRQKIPEKTYCLEINQTLLQEDVRLWRSKSKNKVKHYYRKAV